MIRKQGVFGAEQSHPRACPETGPEAGHILSYTVIYCRILSYTVIYCLILS